MESIKRPSGPGTRGLGMGGEGSCRGLGLDFSIPKTALVWVGGKAGGCFTFSGILVLCLSFSRTTAVEMHGVDGVVDMVVYGVWVAVVDMVLVSALLSVGEFAVRCRL